MLNYLNLNVIVVVVKGRKFDCFKLLRNILITASITVLILCQYSCKKLVTIPEPVNTITSSETFSSDANATSALVAIYNDMISQTDPGFADGAVTFFAGLSADELNYFDNNNSGIIDLQNNTLLSNNSYIKGSIWDKAYFNIYQANAIIEGLTSSNKVTMATKNGLLGEAKFVRAFCYFYLTNFFGDIPLVTTTAWANTQLSANSSTNLIIQQITSDLKDAESLLPNNFSISNNERIRPNKWAAAALLARLYLYTGDWAGAETESSAIINNSSLFSLTILNNVFLKNSNEAIWQLYVSDSKAPYSTQEGKQTLPSNRTVNPTYYLTQQLLNAFESGDQRKVNWVDSTIYSGTTYYYAKKYKVRIGTLGSSKEYYMMLRLGEQYLIRAEAKARQNKLLEAVADINSIRQRSGLQGLTTSLTQQQVIDAIAQEMRIEFFSEWGHRWFDLKRTGRADSILGALKGTKWQPSDQLYPIPLSEILANPNLSQNAGY